ncbi:dirigent protein 1-like [Salvia miltiorrhiza]|uniref:dirigent protein 1-like n=1 Tax=Salvia miltiorrhiza TaxID=226208 RepID=UPI0025ABA1D3|nr:dirigent protein 1-like [Salvia miltiorrhiza]
MAKLNINYPILVVFTLLIATQVSPRKLCDEEDELRLDYICLHNQKLTKIHFYAQDLSGGPNGTVHELARAAVSTDEPFSYGKMYVVDDALTAGPGRGSGDVGRAQGIFTSADMKTTAMAMNFNIVFTSGEYNGSTLSIAGRNQVLDRQRRLAVVGGTGVFRFTRGHAVINAYSTTVGEDSSLYLVIEYFIYTTFCSM